MGRGSGNVVPAVSYNTNYGFGVGNANNPGFNDFYYRSINYNASEENAIRNINDIKQNWNGLFYIGDAEEGINWMKYFSKMTNSEFLVYETNQGLYYDALSGYSYNLNSYKTNYKDAQGTYHAYSYVNWEQNEIVLPQCLTVSKAVVKYIIHPHPYGSNVSDADFYFANYHNIPNIAVGVYNNNITWYRYPKYKVPYNLTPSELYQMINH